MNKIEQILERLRALPPELNSSHQRLYVEAVTPETIAPIDAFFVEWGKAHSAVLAWVQQQGGVGFYPPFAPWVGGEGSTASAFVFDVENAPKLNPAWRAAGSSYRAGPGQVALALSKRKEGKALQVEVDSFTRFPSYAGALAHLDVIQEIKTPTSTHAVDRVGSKIYYNAPLQVGDRYFLQISNHNHTIAQIIQNAMAADDLEVDLDFEGDPIAWRPAAGWQLVSEPEIDLLIAAENVRRAKLRAAEKEAADAG